MIARTADGLTVTYGYDLNNNRLTVADASRTMATTYDRLNRPARVTVSDDAAAVGITT